MSSDPAEDDQSSRELPEDFFELEVITNKPDPRMGDRDLPTE